MEFSRYEGLTFARKPHGVLLITIDGAGSLNPVDERLHRELSQVWLDVSNDSQTRVAVVTGAGDAFSAGGEIAMERRTMGDFAKVQKMLTEARDLVLNMVNCDKPIISAINGVAVGAGLAVALTADISIIGDEVRFTDGHLRVGLTAGDHATILWPLLCGMAKAKYYLLTSEFIDGQEAERIGLVSKCVPTHDVVSEALRIAHELAVGPQVSLRWTKRSLNHWLRNAQPIFESSLALEMLDFFGEDVVEGFDAIEQRRAASFRPGEGVD